MYYRIAEKLAEEPRGAQNGWQGLAAVLRPDELATAGLPRGVAEQAAEKLAECRGCRLTVEPDCIQGELHIPAKGKHKPRNLLFAWWEDSLLFVDRGETAAECLETVRRMRPHHADGADDLLMDFFLALVAEDLGEIQSLEDRISELEQAVLESHTEGFIARMSRLRRELNQRNRFYAQLDDLVTTLQENAADLLDECSQSRLLYVLRRLDRLQNETQLLREYASQVSSEYQAQVDIAQNRIMKLLTIVTTIFMPLSLIVGWYGMNFAYMPELGWRYGYPAVIAVSVLVVGGCVVYFRRKRYW